jgi:acetyl-CoA carboxylase biotin carboxyl carrier protein
MALTNDDVLEIVRLLEHSDVSYLEVDDGQRRVVVRKGPSAPGADVPAPPSSAPPAAAPPPAAAAPVTAAPTHPAPDPVAATPSETVAATTSATADEDVVTVLAPIVGVFYVAPEPGAQPYVEVGSRVTSDSTVGLIEVMKMFNSVTAGVDGEVVEVLARNEQFVEFNQPLMKIRPTAP